MQPQTLVRRRSQPVLMVCAFSISANEPAVVGWGRRVMVRVKVRRARRRWWGRCIVVGFGGG